jgi:high mobility group protein B1
MSSTTESLKKPATAYFLWMNANREKIQTMIGSKDFKSVAGKASELWTAATAKEKAPFEAEVKRQKEAYEAFIGTEAGQKALQQKKAEKKDEKQAKQDKDAEKARAKEEKQVARERRECKAAVKAVEKDDKLKKPMTSYFMWFTDNRERISKIVGSKGSDVAKKGSQMWKELAEKEKKPYEERAQKAKATYDAYIASPEGAAALKAFKEATSAVSYKEKEAPSEEAADEAEEGSPQKAGGKRAGDATATNGAAKKSKGGKDCKSWCMSTVLAVQRWGKHEGVTRETRHNL